MESFCALLQAAPACSVLGAHAAGAHARTCRDNHKLPLPWPPQAEASDQARDLSAYYESLVATSHALEGPPALQLHFTSKAANMLVAEVKAADTSRLSAARSQVIKLLHKRMTEALKPPTKHKSAPPKRGAAFSRSCGTASMSLTFSTSAAVSQACAPGRPKSMPAQSEAWHSAGEQSVCRDSGGFALPPLPSRLQRPGSSNVQSAAAPNKRGRSREAAAPAGAQPKRARVQAEAGGSRDGADEPIGDGCYKRSRRTRSSCGVHGMTARAGAVPGSLRRCPWNPEDYYRNSGAVRNGTSAPPNIDQIGKLSAAMPPTNVEDKSGITLSIPVDTCNAVLTAIAHCSQPRSARRVTRRASAACYGPDFTMMRALCFAAAAALARRRQHTRLFLGSLVHAPRLAFAADALQRALLKASVLLFVCFIQSTMMGLASRVV